MCTEDVNCRARAWSTDSVLVSLPPLDAACPNDSKWRSESFDTNRTSKPLDDYEDIGPFALSVQHRRSPLSGNNYSDDRMMQVTQSAWFLDISLVRHILTAKA